MLVRRILELDFDEIEKWFRAREMPVPERSLFPKIGFIVDNIAAGFIYFTDSSVAIIDCYISNPKSDKRNRDEALRAITGALITTAKFHKVKLLKCDTSLDAVKIRAEASGFKRIGAFDSFTMEI